MTKGILKDSFVTVIKITGLILSLGIMMFLITFPLTMIAQLKGGFLGINLFQWITILVILLIVVFLSKKKYLNMLETDAANTRVNKKTIPLKTRFIYSVLLKPILIVFVIISYAVFLYTFIFPLKMNSLLGSPGLHFILTSVLWRIVLLAGIFFYTVLLVYYARKLRFAMGATA